MTISRPTQPTDDVTMVVMPALPTACASRTPDRPMTYSPSVIPTSVCLTTSEVDRLKRVMSGVITAPTMKPPATSVVPCNRLSDGPGGAEETSAPRSWRGGAGGGAEETSAPRSWRVSSEMIDQPTRIRNAGTVRYAVQAMEWKPRTTIAVT